MCVANLVVMVIGSFVFVVDCVVIADVLFVFGRVSFGLKKVPNRECYNAVTRRAFIASSISTEAFQESSASKTYKSDQIQVKLLVRMHHNRVLWISMFLFNLKQAAIERDVVLGKYNFFFIFL